MSDKKLKSWQSWLIFGGSMLLVFCMGLVVSALMERRSEVASIFNNRKNPMHGIVAQNQKFESDFPREYETWRATENTDFRSKYMSSEAQDVLEERPNMVILWAGYAFSWEYNSPRGHFHAIDDMRRILRTGAPTSLTDGSNQPGTCWTCKGPDVPRLMEEHGPAEFYKSNWAKWGSEVVNPIGCSDCHDSETMDLHISRTALREAFARRGTDVDKATHNEMRSLVCAQCHVEYYFQDLPETSEHDQYLTFPQDYGFTLEDAEKYYDERNYYDYIHALSKAPILKAQHPGYELSLQGIHGQRGVACADCHMPYTTDGGVKFSDHQIQSPLAKMDRTCLVCHRESEETLRQNVYERQEKCIEVRNRLEEDLAKVHIEAKFAWDKGATEAEMHDVLQLIRKSQWRWDYAVASHGASFHAPQEVIRLMSNGIDYAQEARLQIAKVLARHGYTGDVPMPDISTKAKAQEYIGLDMAGKVEAKEQFLQTIVPQWIAKAKEQGKLLDY
ncbi:MAG: ammonia-forming cytochrome c nitrite reductase [Bacteroidales bacterium]|jgi:nitrite reductase (cytochrome c-552)|nr:ammonia-forming cytochrome c nitrite reductase [Bacteroidales bacterium]MCI2134110.1 ammonia-forming cytochrome c nitrite reductase [Bacteroidales bacterium]